MTTQHKLQIRFWILFSEPGADARAAATPRRILATILFTDIVASTERAQQLGDNTWRELLKAHDATVRREIMRYRGNEIKSTGDGFLADFDGPARAIRCAIAIAEAMGPLGIQIRAGCTPEKWSGAKRMCSELPFTLRHVSWVRRLLVKWSFQGL